VHKVSPHVSMTRRPKKDWHVIAVYLVPIINRVRKSKTVTITNVATLQTMLQMDWSQLQKARNSLLQFEIVPSLKNAQRTNKRPYSSVLLR